MEFAVIGLGMFGRSVARNLVRHGQSVLAIDSDERETRSMATELDAVVCADATDESALRELHIERMSCVVVAIGAAAKENSILATALLRQIGVPRIVSRALGQLHARVLRAVGAHIVVSPEEEMGERVAYRLAKPSIRDRLELGENIDLAEVDAPEALVGQTLVEADLRRKYAVSVVAIRRGGGIQSTVTGTDRLESGDVLLVIGAPAAISRLASLV